MRAVLIANPKGGTGKTTIATNLAGALAAKHQRVVLGDLDRQRSSLCWLSIRPSDRPVIDQLDARDSDDTPPGDADWLILDSPAGLRGKNLGHALKLAHKVVVPVQPSVFDIAATKSFLQELLEEKPARKHGAFVGIVGMRVDPRTRAASTLEAFLGQYDLPVLTYLRDTQVYVNAAFNGLSIFDLPEYVGGRDVEQWQALLEWVDGG